MPRFARNVFTTPNSRSSSNAPDLELPCEPPHGVLCPEEYNTHTQVQLAPEPGPFPVHLCAEKVEMAWYNTRAPARRGNWGGSTAKNDFMPEG